MDKVDIADYVSANIVDPLSRVPGVGTIQVFGGKYAMRIWLDPNKLHTYELSIPEVTAAITAQNAQVAIGSLGAAPARSEEHTSELQSLMRPSYAVLCLTQKTKDATASKQSSKE